MPRPVMIGLNIFFKGVSMSTAKAVTIESIKTPSFVREGAMIILASFLIGVLGQLAIPLPFTPVPIATQNMVILLLAALLGPRRACSAVMLFLLQGAGGLPVFANGAAGIAKLVGPTGGYLFGYLAAAFVTGTLFEKIKNRTLLNGFLSLAAGAVTIYLCGASYLATFVGVQKALLLGVAPFLLGDLLKIVIAMKLLRWAGWEK